MTQGLHSKVHILFSSTGSNIIVAWKYFFLQIWNHCRTVLCGCIQQSINHNIVLVRPVGIPFYNSANQYCFFAGDIWSSAIVFYLSINPSTLRSFASIKVTFFFATNVQADGTAVPQSIIFHSALSLSQTNQNILFLTDYEVTTVLWVPIIYKYNNNER